MYVVAITGGIGAGKSAAASLLADKGAQSIDLDRISRDVTQPGSEVLEQLAQRFGQGIIAEDGALDRQALADVAFADARSVTDLDAIVHPAIIRVMLERIDGFRRSAGDSDVLVVEVPLLHLYPEIRAGFDETVTVAAALCTREERAHRRGMTPWDFEARDQAQPGDAARAAISDTVFDNDGDLDALRAQVDAWWDERVRAGWSSPRGPR